MNAKLDNDLKFFELLARNTEKYKITYDGTYLYIIANDDKQDHIIKVKNIETVLFLSEVESQIRIKIILKCGSMFINITTGYISVSL